MLEDRHAGAIVPASLVEQVSIAYAKDVDTKWRAFASSAHASASSTVPTPEHDHWEWEKKVSVTARLLPYQTMAIECLGDTQGMMLLETDQNFARLPTERGRPLVYVMFLAAAPWNLPAYASRPRFRGVGTMLLRAAIETSIDLGFKGRIGLHSLPQADAFYSRTGLIPLGADSKKQNLTYFEMDPQAAAAFMK